MQHSGSILQALLGIFVFSLICYFFSENRKGVRWRIVGWGLGLQFLIAICLFKMPLLSHGLSALARFFEVLSEATKVGTSFVFGYLGGAPVPFKIEDPANMFVFAINPLMTVFIVSALSGLFWYWGLLPRVLQALAFLFRKTMNVSGAVAFAGCANIFFAMTEVISMIRPTLQKMSRAELLQMMTVGMTTIAGSMFVVYAQFLEPLVPNAMQHVLVASFIHMPAGLVMAYLLIPHDVSSAENMLPNSQKIYQESTSKSSLDAFFEGALNGIPIVVNCIVMLIAALAALHLVDMAVDVVAQLFTDKEGMTLAKVTAPFFAPLTWLMGIPAVDVLLSAEFLGTKTVVNEFVALAKLSAVNPGALQETTKLALTYSLVSFANFTTAALMSGALYAIIPERREEITVLTLKCVLSGLLATCCTGSVIVILHGLGLI